MKVFIRYEFSKPGQYMMGTGWLVAPDLFVTAGHCSYDWSKKLGRAIEVKSYIGYEGKASIGTKDVEFRKVKRITTTEGWVRAKGQKAFDVSFMQVDQPFTGVKSYKFEDTKPYGNLNLGVVGYPGDLNDPTTKENGAYMYEMFLPTEYDLATQADTMLEYQIDTFGGESIPSLDAVSCCLCRQGNSGSPVFRQEDLVSIGCHVYGGENNSASVIGSYGNPYGDYLAAFKLTLPPGYALHLVPVKKDEPRPLVSTNSLKRFSSISGGGTQSSRIAQPRRELSSQARRAPATPLGLNDPSLHSEAEEGLFGDILKGVGSALPIFGGPIGTLAGVALNAAGSMLETTTAEGFSDTTTVPEGAVERAILAEATLKVLQNTKLPEDVEEGIFEDMKTAVMKALPTVRKTAPRVIGAMMEPALKMALGSLHNYNQRSAGGAESFDDNGPVFGITLPVTQYSAAIDQPADQQTEAFLHAAMAAARDGQESFGDSETEEGFFDIFKSATRLIGKGVLGVAKVGLPIVADYLNKTAGAEAFDAESNSGNDTADLLAKRALVADAALQAIMKVPAHQLQEEGFFGSLWDTVKSIAPGVMKAAPGIIKAINPTIGGIISGLTGQESVSAGNSFGNGFHPRRLAPAPIITPKRSVGLLRGN